jgi:hypothetical protein
MPAKRDRGRRTNGAEGGAGAASMTISALPDELLLHVFSFVCSESLLTSVGGVCRRWRSLYGDTPGVCLDLSFLGAYESLAEHHSDGAGVRMAMALSRRWRHIVQITLGDYCCSGVILAALAPQCPKLAKVVHVVDDDRDDEFNEDDLVADTHLVTLAMHCPRLTHVIMVSTNLSDVGVMTLAEQCPQLKMLDISRCEELSDASVLACVKHCRRIADVSFRWCKLMTDSVVVALATGCPHLTSICFDRCGLTDDALLGLALHSSACPLLTRVKFSENDGVTNVGICALAKSYGQLATVDFSFCDVSNEAVLALASGCPRLSRVDLAGCEALTNEAVIALVERCTELVHISFRDCDGITSDALIALAVLVPKNCPKLALIYVPHFIPNDSLVMLMRLVPQLMIRAY